MAVGVPYHLTRDSGEPEHSMPVVIDGGEVVVGESVPAVQNTHYRCAHANQSVGRPYPEVLFAILQEGRYTVVGQRRWSLERSFPPIPNQQEPIAQSPKPHASLMVFCNRADDALRLGASGILRARAD